jgi:hypothetical protein
MKKGKIIFGLALIFLAVLLILDAFNVLAPLSGIVGEISIWSILLGLILLAFVITRLWKGKISEVFVPLALIFMLFEENISVLFGCVTSNIINNWLVLLIAVLISAGIHMIMNAGKNHFVHTSVTDAGVQASKRKRAGGSLGHSTVYIDSETMIPNQVENNLGYCAVYFENPEAYKGNGTLYIENNLGNIKLHIPNAWYAKVDMENNLGGITIPEKNDPTAPSLYIRGENNLGAVQIVYV